MSLCTEISTQLMLHRKNGRENIVTSPLSMNILLNILAVGTKGRTQKQLLDALKLETPNDINTMSSNMMAVMNNANIGPNKTNARRAQNEYGVAPTVSLVNGVWADHRLSFKPSFKKVAIDIYGADIRTFDFLNEAEKVVKEVNSWAEKETKGLIKDLLSRIHEDTNLILANALYFKGAWLQPFQKRWTRKENFYLLNGETAKVPFMTGSKYQYCRFFDDYKLLRLPYQRGSDETRKFSMYIFLPNEQNGLENLLKRINSNPLMLNEKCVDRKELGKTLVPKFKFQYEFKVSDMMMGMGIDLPFMDLGELDMFDTDRGFVSEIIQKSYIEVKEGTEAAAVTYVQMDKASYYQPPPPPPEDFVADHPFFFMIKEDVSESILFSGVVVNPLMP